MKNYIYAIDDRKKNKFILSFLIIAVLIVISLIILLVISTVSSSLLYLMLIVLFITNGLIISSIEYLFVKSKLQIENDIITFNDRNDSFVISSDEVNRINISQDKNKLIIVLEIQYRSNILSLKLVSYKLLVTLPSIGKKLNYKRITNLLLQNKELHSKVNNTLIGT
jgi:hypothetical protein